MDSSNDLTAQLCKCIFLKMHLERHPDFRADASSPLLMEVFDPTYIRNHGQEVRYRSDYFGLNWRMTDLAAAIGSVQMHHIERWNEARIANATRLAAGITSVQTPKVREGDRHVFHQFTVRVGGDRDAIQKALLDAGVGSAIHYPMVIHQQPIMIQMGFDEGVSTPVAEAAAASVLSLPVHPSLSEEDLERIITVVNRLAH